MTKRSDFDDGVQPTKYDPSFEVVSSFGNGTVCSAPGDSERMLPFQVSYDDSVNPKYPGR